MASQRFRANLRWMAAAIILLSTAGGAVGKPAAKDDTAVAAAREALTNGRLDECEAKLALVLRADQGNLAARQLHAEVLYKLGRFHFAADQLRPVLDKSPDNAEAWLLMGQICQSMHKPKPAIDAYKKFIAMSPQDTRAQQYGALISVLEDEAAKQAARRKEAAQGGDNYLAAVTASGLLRWKMPSAISVYVIDGTGITGYRPEFEESLRQAFDEWSENTDGRLAFNFVQDPAKGQLTVTWTSDLHAPALTAESGLAKTNCGPDGIEKAEVLLLTVDPYKEGPIGKNYLYNVCLHEIGHALGLQGHSPHEEDIMSSALSVQQGLSPRDIRTILALYSDNAGTTVALPDVDEYGRPLSAKVKAERLAREGSTAAGAGEFEKAISKLQDALKLDANAPMAKENLAVALNNLAVSKDTKPERAVELLRHALYWNPKSDFARNNLNTFLQSVGHDPKSFAERVKLAEQCAAKNDTKGAFVEYSEALAIKEDAAVRNKLKALPAG